MRGPLYRRLAGPIIVVLLTLAVLPASGVAAGSSAVPPASIAAAGSSAVPPGSAALYLSGAFSVQHRPVTVAGRPVTITGVVHPYAAGQSVTVSVVVNGRVLHRKRVGLRLAPAGTYGVFKAIVASPKAGQVVVVARHDATAQLGQFRAAKSFAALDDRVTFGATGRFVQLLQQRLAALHFFIPQTGVYDSGTGLAVDAYHRLLHWGTYQTLDKNTVIWLLNGWGAFPVRYAHDGRHAEGNLGLQLLALIDRGKVQAIYPISSGKPSTPTILGRFHVYDKVPWSLPDGMYFSSFFWGGYAIHGYNPAPDYPASHGCMRVPMQDAVSIYNWLHMGDGVDTYY